MEVFTNPFDFQSLKDAWTTAKPFSHVVLDDFLTTTAANQIVKEFPAFNDNVWYDYENAIEIKKALNSWDRFGPTTYQLFWFLNSDAFISRRASKTHDHIRADAVG